LEKIIENIIGEDVERKSTEPSKTVNAPDMV
jgi:hypothetical protein